MKNKIKICGGYVKVGDYAIINNTYPIGGSVGKRIKIKQIVKEMYFPITFPITNMSGNIFMTDELSTVNYYKKNKK